jgi:hypothetical protein
MNGFVPFLQAQTSAWFFDPESVQERGCITLQKSLDDCEGYVVVRWKDQIIIEAKDSWMIGMKTIITPLQEEEYDEFMGEVA